MSVEQFQGHGMIRDGLSEKYNTIPGESTSDYCARLPQRQHGYEVKGWILYLPRTGITVVPNEPRSGGWDCTVVGADPAGVYPVGGYNLFVGRAEIRCAFKLFVPHPKDGYPPPRILEGEE